MTLFYVMTATGNANVLSDIVRNGGASLWIILLLGMIALTIFLEKVLYFHRVQVNTSELVRGLLNTLKKGNMLEAISLCDDTPGPTAHILRAVIISHEQGDKNPLQAVDDAALSEIPRLETRMNILSTIAYICPLLGLFGTVLGMISVFAQLSELGSSGINISELSGGIKKALYCTAGGLAVAIPCYVAYSYLLSRIQNIVLDMEKASSEMLYFFEHNKEIFKNRQQK